MRKRILLGFAATVGIAVVLAFLFHFRNDPELSGIERVPEGARVSSNSEVHSSYDRTSRTRQLGRFVPPWERQIEKRVPKVDSSQLAWLGDGWRLVEEGQFVAARVRFQKLINEHAGEAGMPYAFLAISETFALEGGEENLRAAYAGFRDFLVFYPGHELAAHASARIAELKPMLPPKRTPANAR